MTQSKIKRVLLINSDKPEPIHLLQQRKNLEIIPLIDKRYQYLDIYKTFPQKILVDDISDIQQVSAGFHNVSQEGRIDFVVAATDKCMAVGGYLRSLYGLPGMSFDAANAFSNKLAMKHKLQDSNVPIASFKHLSRLADLTDTAEQIGWPVIVKPAIGSGAVNVVKIKDIDHLRSEEIQQKLSTIEKVNSPLMVEKCLNLTGEYHCDGIVRDSTIRWSAVSKYFQPPLEAKGTFYGGLHLKAGDPIVQDIQSMTEDVIKALGLQDGVFHMEILDENGKLTFGEIASRPGGAGIPASLKCTYGIDLWKAFIESQIHLDHSQSVEKSYDNIRGYCGLPAKNGIIQQISTSEEILKIAGTTHVEISYKPGDILNEKESAVFFAGLLQFELNNNEEVDKYLSSLTSAYHIVSTTLD